MKKEKVLEIAIPTYNRTVYLKKCLISILESIKCIPLKDKKSIGLVISDNSTKDILNRKKVIEKFKKKFETCGIGYFTHRVTGYNIGSIHNFFSIFSNTDSKYIWILPDDDIARLDSIKTILKTIYKYQPCFIAGGWTRKSKIGYLDDVIKNDDQLPNKVHAVLQDQKKINTFFLKSIVQAQEYIYKTSEIKSFFYNDQNLKLLNNMMPGLMAIYSMRSNLPVVLLEASVGLFRHDEPSSEWRHEWLRVALQDWPILARKIYKLRWINKKQFNLAIEIYSNLLFTAAPYRPDIYIGLNKSSDLSFFKLLKIYKFKFLKALLKSILNIIFESIRRLGLFFRFDNFKK